MEVPELSVSQFLATLNQTLDYAYPVIKVSGEVSNFKVSRQKFIFFDLKDHESSVSCFATVWQLKVPLEDGMKIVVAAKPKLTNWGKFSLTIQAAKPVGEGAIKRSQDLLRQKLEKEGLFDEERKRILPSMPRRVAVISSVQSAGYADFMKILGQRTGGMNLQVADVQVQGEAAPMQIVRAIEYCNNLSELPEVLILTRGGGSADDLAAWSDERVVRAIAASRVPTLVGVGHEVDTTLADLAADVRAATPTNAAQLLVSDKTSVIEAAQRSVRLMVEQSYEAVLDERRDTRQSLTQLHQLARRRADDAKNTLASQRAMLRAYDPQRIFERGYALVRGKIAVGNSVEIETAMEVATMEVHDVRHKTNPR